MTIEEAIKKNPFDPNKGNESAYCRYLRYNIKGWYNLDSKEVLKRWQKVRNGMESRITGRVKNGGNKFVLNIIVNIIYMKIILNVVIVLAQIIVL